jgi:hypothetical protein
MNHPLTLSDIKYPNSPPILSGVGFPSASASIESHTAGKLSKTDVDPIKDGTLTIYVFGKLDYSDVFRKTHWTEFCFVVDKDLTHAAMCQIYNTTDDEKQK